MSKSDKAEEEEEEDKAELGDNCLFTGALESDHDSEVKVYLIIYIFYFRHFPTYNRWLWTDAWETTRQKWTSIASLFHAVWSILSSPRQPSCLSSFFKDSLKCFQDDTYIWKQDDEHMAWHVKNKTDDTIRIDGDVPSANAQPWNKPLPKVDFHFILKTL